MATTHTKRRCTHTRHNASRRAGNAVVSRGNSAWTSQRVDISSTHARWLHLNCADCEFHQLRRSGFDTSIAQIHSFTRTRLKVLRALRTILSEYQDHEHKFSKWLHTIFCLHHLEPDDVEDAFVDEIMSICPDHSGCTAFAICYRAAFCVL